MVATALFGGIRVWSLGGLTGLQTTPSVSRPTQSNRVLHGARHPSLLSDSEGRSSAYTAPATKINGKVMSRDTAARRRYLCVTIILLATFRTSSVLLSLISLKHVPASFTETIKSTAPLFTVYLQHLLLGMRTSPQVLVSLIPVMAGLVVCAHAEVSFDATGFWAAVANNVIDCLQNVMSKKTLDMLSPIHLQFYTSCLGLLFQIPLMLLRDIRFGIVLDPRVWNPIFLAGSARDAFVAATTNVLSSRRTLAYYAVDLFCYHTQSLSAYYVVASLSPVSVSVANTLKRSLLIAISIAYFGNKMTDASVLGLLIVIAGVFLYNAARAKVPAADEARHQRIKPHSNEEPD